MIIYAHLYGIIITLLTSDLEIGFFALWIIVLAVLCLDAILWSWRGVHPTDPKVKEDVSFWMHPIAIIITIITLILNKSFVPAGTPVGGRKYK